MDHALGFSHPDGEHGLAKDSADTSLNGYAPAYTDRMTGLSYNGDSDREASVGDVMVGQQTYGMPKDDGTFQALLSFEWVSGRDGLSPIVEVHRGRYFQGGAWC